MLNDFIQQHRLSSNFAQIAKQWFMPVAEKIVKSVTEETPYFIGINGCQGSGKSTLASFLKAYLEQSSSLTVAVLSLDDFYLTQHKREILAEQVHPLLQTRGVPGTHNITLLKQVLANLQQQRPTLLPRFNKATDNPFEQAQWPEIARADIVIFEGWCWGVSPQTTEALSQPCNTLEKELDASSVWRQYVNQQLTEHYQPLYQFMNIWLMLSAPSFTCVKKWRWQQEEKLKAELNANNQATNATFTESEIEFFIQHFQRLTEHGLATLPQQCDYTFTLDDNRNITTLRSKNEF